jgi:hypothetical protein
MPDETLQSLLRVLDYILPDEMKHWDGNNRPHNHIFPDIKRVSDWALAEELKRRAK